MKTYILIRLIFVLVSFTYAQEHPSVHKYHKELFGVESKLALENDSNEMIRPLTQRKAKSELSKVVFGYLPDWEYLNGNQQYLRYDLLSHIACFDFAADANGNLSIPAGWPWTDVINTAHDNGVKIILTVTKFGSSTSADAEIHELLTDPVKIQNFYSQVVSKLKTYQMDGVNIDFESYASADEGQVTVDFMRGLTEYVKAELPEAEISFATPIVNWGGDWDLPGLIDVIDYAFIMGYAFWGGWSSTTGPNAPLTGSFRNITRSLNEDYAQVVANNPEKLILGLPYYGGQWATFSPDPYTTELDTTVAYFNIRFRSAEPLAQTYGRQWDNISNTPWVKSGLGNQWTQAWFDDDSSMGLKYDLAIQNNLMGVGMWALGYDGERQELWNLIDMKFGSGRPPAPLEPENLNITVIDESSVNINFTSPKWAESYEVMVSTDGIIFRESGISFSNEILVENLSEDSVYYFKVAASNVSGSSSFTEVLASSPSEFGSVVLLVNGFDRLSGTNNTRDYIRMYGDPILKSGYSFSSASNEAVYKGLIDLKDYNTVIWILGDESRSDETFNSLEQQYVQDYLEAGRNLFVTGSEIGYDLVQMGGSKDKIFFTDYMKADYISDAPNDVARTYYSVDPINESLLGDLSPFSFDDGSYGTFDVDWPDAIEAIDGASNLLKFSGLNTSAGYAGIAYEGSFGSSSDNSKLVYLSVPFETIYSEQVRIDLMAKVIEFFETLTSINDEVKIPDEFILYNNYPNPFNPVTTINYNIPVTVPSPAQRDKLREGPNVRLVIYDILGREVITLVNKAQLPGHYTVQWDASNYSSGIYFYELSVPGLRTNRKKMILVK